MNILVTGGAGFIGSHVADAYIEAGHRVTVIDNLSSGKRDNLHEEADFHQVDIRGAEIREIFDHGKFDVLNHHAAQMDVRRSVADPIFDASVNVLGSLNLFEAARETGVKKIVFASTGGAIYGEQDYFPADEEHPLRPVSPYGVTKLTAEKYLHYYKEIHGIDYAILRYANVYGPRQNPHGEAGVVAIFATKLLKNEQAVINGDGSQTRDYVYVGDVVRANLLALQSVGSSIFNVGTGKETDVNTVFQLLKARLNTSAVERHGPAKSGEQKRSVISADRLYSAFGWRPQTPLADGIALTAEFFRSRQRAGAS